MHINQKKVLALLMKQDNQRYADLNSHFEEEDRFPYHLKQLVSNGFISKRDDLYFITIQGARQFVNFEAKSLADVENKLPVLVLIIKYGDKYLLRKNGDDYGLWPIRLYSGVEIEETINEKLEKYNLKGTFAPAGYRNMMRFSDGNELIYDNIFIAYEVNADEINNLSAEFKLFDLAEIQKFAKQDTHELTWEFVLN